MSSKHATETEVALSEELGYTHNPSKVQGSEFVKERRVIWPTLEGRWLAADEYAPRRYENHRIYRDLSKALRRPYPDP